MNKPRFGTSPSSTALEEKYSVSVRERRQNPRKPFTAGAIAVEPISEDDIQLHTSEITQGGCYLDALNSFPTGTEVQLRLTKNDLSFQTRARVIHCQNGVGMGLLFTQIPQAQRPVLEKWLADLNGAIASRPSS